MTSLHARIVAAACAMVNLPIAEFISDFCLASGVVEDIEFRNVDATTWSGIRDWFSEEYGIVIVASNGLVGINPDYGTMADAQSSMILGAMHFLRLSVGTLAAEADIEASVVQKFLIDGESISARDFERLQIALAHRGVITFRERRLMGILMSEGSESVRLQFPEGSVYDQGRCRAKMTEAECFEFRVESGHHLFDTLNAVGEAGGRRRLAQGDFPSNRATLNRILSLARRAGLSRFSQNKVADVPKNVGLSG